MSQLALSRSTFESCKPCSSSFGLSSLKLLGLHPPGRQQNEYCRNFRQDSSLSRGWCSIHKRLPTIDEGLERLLEREDTTTLLDLARAGCLGDSKCMAYNPINVLDSKNKHAHCRQLSFGSTRERLMARE